MSRCQGYSLVRWPEPAFWASRMLPSIQSQMSVWLATVGDLNTIRHFGPPAIG